MIRIVSWNVNGVRAVAKKGFPAWLAETNPDVLCLQETKAHPDQLPDELRIHPGYDVHWTAAEKKGYSGVATFVRKGIQIQNICSMGLDEFDREGRVQILDLDGFTVVNAYFPNSQDAGMRLDYKLSFCQAMLAACEARRSRGTGLVICGDFNIAHKPIDLANPRANEKNPGYLPEERAWMDHFVGTGYVDTFRLFNDQPGHYTWWTYRFQARQRNIGWRLDYHFVNQEFRDRVHSARILGTVQGSDHCPVEVALS